MNTALTHRRLTHSLALLAVLAAGHLQAENGSERSLEHQRQVRGKQALQIAEGGAERSQALRRA